MMYSVTDIAGLNRISRAVLAQCRPRHRRHGQAQRPADDAGKPAIGLTMFGVTTPSVTQTRRGAQIDDYDCLVFHATGTGGRAMEKLADSGMLVGVDRRHDDRSLRPPVRRRAQRRRGPPRRDRPHAASPMSARSAPSTWSTSGRSTPSRTLPQPDALQHNPNVTLMRTTADENAAQIGAWIAERLNRCDGPVRFLIPENGVSALDAPGQRLLRPGGRRARCSTRSKPTFQRNRPAAADQPAAPHQRPGVFADASSRTSARSRVAESQPMAAISSAKDPRQLPRHGRAAACRSSAAAPAPASRPNARRPAASTSSSSTTPAATAWPAAARRPGCSPMATPTRSSRTWRARCCRWSSTRRCSPASTAPTRSC